MSINQIIEPYLIDLLQAVLVALGAGAINWLIKDKKRFMAWLDAHTTANQREILAKLAEDAYSFVESFYKNEHGSIKLDKAIKFVGDRLQSKYGFNVQDISAAIQKAWIQLDPKSRLGIITPDPVTVEVEKPLAPEAQQLLDAAKTFANTVPPSTAEPVSKEPASA